MTIDIGLLTDPSRCPSCARALPPGAARCPECRVDLSGPTAAQVWNLSRRAVVLLSQRQALVEALRQAVSASPDVRAERHGTDARAEVHDASLGVQPPQGHAYGRGGESAYGRGGESAYRRGGAHAYDSGGGPAFDMPPYSGPPSRPAGEASRTGVRNILLGLGVLLLAVAGLIFTVVAWGAMGIGGRAAVLVAVTAATASAAELTRRRRLDATAEALSILSVALLLLDAYAARAANLLGAGTPDPATYWAAACAVIAALAAAAGWSRGRRVLTPRFIAAAVGQLPVPLIATTVDSESSVSALLLGQSLVLVLLDGWARSWRGGSSADAATTALRGVVHAGAALTFLVAAGMATLQAFGILDDPRLLGSALLVAAAAVAAAAAVTYRGSWGRHVPAAVAAAALLAAAWSVVTTTPVPGGYLPPAGVALVLAAGAAVSGLTRRWRPGPVTTSVGAATLVLAAVLPSISLALMGPLGWWSRRWTLLGDAPARSVVSPDVSWPAAGSIDVATVVLLAIAAAILGRAVDRRTAGSATAWALALAALVATPLALDWSHHVAVLWLVGLCTAMVVVSAVAEPRHVGPQRRPTTPRWSRIMTAVSGAASVPLTIAVLWASPYRWLSLVVLAAAASLAAAAGATARTTATRSGWAAGATVLAAATTYAVSRALGGTVPTAATAAAVLVALALAAAANAGRRRSGSGLAPHLGATMLPVEVAAAVTYLGTLAASAADQHRLVVVLTVGGVGCALAAVDPAHRRLSWVSGALLTAASWVRLNLADVTAVEAYVVPPAVALLAAGWLARRHTPAYSSWRAYGPGLSTGLLPVLAVAVEDERLTRPLLLGAVALGVVLVGATRRLQAPLALGGAVLAVVALDQLWPYASALPRWAALAVVGSLLLVLGATYERRLRDVRIARDRFAGLA